MTRSKPGFFSLIWKFKGFRLFTYVLLTVTVICSIGSLVFTSYISPNNISYPKTDHLHFRMQIVYNGKSENFGDNKYQEDYEKGQCTAQITKSPIHFHDQKNQIIHVHWKGMSGGQVLKYYGLNLIGGVDDVLGFRLDEFSKSGASAVKIHGKILPKLEKDDKIYIYSGEKDNFQKKSIEDFKNQTLETFFGKKSNLGFLNIDRSSNIFQPIVTEAHGNGDGHDAEDKTSSEMNKIQEELKEINNLLGNIVIFIQKDEPNENQIKERFNQLEPLSPSTCGG